MTHPVKNKRSKADKAAKVRAEHRRWLELPKAERDEIMRQRRIKQGLPEGKKVYSKVRIGVRDKSLKPKEIEKRLVEITGCAPAEARYWFYTICALVRHELEHERQFRLPGSVLIEPQKIQNYRYFDAHTQSWYNKPDWIRMRAHMDADLKAEYRKRYPSEESDHPKNYNPHDFKSEPTVDDLC